MSELTHQPVITDPLTQDILHFTKIVETAHQERLHMPTASRDSALRAGHAMLAAWNTLADPETGSAMPELRARVADYLADHHLPLGQVRTSPRTVRKLAYMAHSILDELYISLPMEYDNPRLLAEVSGVRGLRALLYKRSPEGKLILGAFRYLFPE
jgi:hypothetical protein